MAELATVEKQDVVTITTQDVKEYIAPNATDKEVYMFLNICKSYGLNPFKREVHFVKYGDKPGQTIVGYEIYLKRAEATGKLDGWKCWIEGEKAKIVIHRNDRKYPFEWEVDASEFNKKQSTWLNMPHFMLKKVCIAQAFRLCFPEEMGGMPYIPEEIGVEQNGKHVDVEPEEIKTPPPAKPLAQYRSELIGMIKDLSGGNNDEAKKYVKLLGYDKTSHIPDSKLIELHGKVAADYKVAFTENTVEELV